ncbi:MSHA biogenesis protein MshJ [Glaciimonas immobilis]|uniref:MSHA biogenesis protein MshJ n=1 Tax=Glaciimonas immobilis TaxID=728004 RepID=A0A840RN83_9BURK|nr:MSHA biogenesis protein MshJ [Glaciimonas immobilis]KAF3998990.1 MSHA biogenesis protein MshJ [Glaciimonas immobilis]MBB5198408.1 MSHA biogenesis protein MshJ [Glaciimonas immobilis]
MIFIGVLFIIILLLNAFLFGPQFDRQKKMSLHIQTNQAKIALMQTTIQEKVRARAFDPNISDNALLKKLQEQSLQLRSELLGLNNVLVKPENMTSLLQDILKRNGALRLISLNTLPVTSLTPAGSNEVKDPADKTRVAEVTKAVAPASATQTSGGVYKHSVEIVVQGTYPDMVRYMSTLEALPWQIFWGKATMQTNTYPEATFNLTLFTLSLDEKWLNL